MGKFALLLFSILTAASVWSRPASSTSTCSTASRPTHHRTTRVSSSRSSTSLSSRLRPLSRTTSRTRRSSTCHRFLRLHSSAISPSGSRSRTAAIWRTRFARSGTSPVHQSTSSCARSNFQFLWAVRSIRTAWFFRIIPDNLDNPVNPELPAFPDFPVISNINQSFLIPS